jgi:hypothetical protein
MGNLEQLVIDLKESLERQLGDLTREMREGFASMNTKFDNQAARLDRHAGLWQAGSRWSARMDTWAEKVDSALEVKDREITELRERVRKLEERRDV